MRAARSSFCFANSPVDWLALEERLPPAPSDVELLSLLTFDEPASLFSFGVSVLVSFFSLSRSWSLSLLSFRSTFSFRDRRSLRVSLYFFTFSLSLSFSSLGGVGSLELPAAWPLLLSAVLFLWSPSLRCSSRLRCRSSWRREFRLSRLRSFSSRRCASTLFLSVFWRSPPSCFLPRSRSRSALTSETRSFLLRSRSTGRDLIALTTIPSSSSWKFIHFVI